MGRGNHEIKYDEKRVDERFKKRKANVIKKASELATLCDINVALVFFSPKGDLLAYSSKNTVEEVFNLLKDIPPQKRGKHYTGNQYPNKEVVEETQNKRRQKVAEDREETKKQNLTKLQGEEIERNQFPQDSEAHPPKAYGGETRGGRLDDVARIVAQRQNPNEPRPEDSFQAEEADAILADLDERAELFSVDSFEAEDLDSDERIVEQPFHSED